MLLWCIDLSIDFIWRLVGTRFHTEEKAKSRHMLWRTASLVWSSARRVHVVRTLGHGLSPSSLEPPDAPDAWHARSCGR